MTDWLDALRKEVELHKGIGGIKAVAEKLGYSRTAISLALAGKYPGNTKKIEQAVMDKLDSFGGYLCPATGRRISGQECKTMRESEAPVHNPARMRQWSVCWTCPNNPNARVKPAEEQSHD